MLNLTIHILDPFPYYLRRASSLVSSQVIRFKKDTVKRKTQKNLRLLSHRYFSIVFPRDTFRAEVVFVKELKDKRD